MAETTPNVIFIGIPEVGEFLKELKPEWNFQDTVPSIEELWDGLSSKKIDSNAQVLLVMDHFFDETGENDGFETLVSTMSPHCLLGIINYNPDNNGLMSEKIENQSFNDSSSSAQYYFISKSKPLQTLDEAVKKYTNDPNSNPAVVSILTGRDMNQVTQEKEEFIQEQESYSESSDEIKENDVFGQVVSVTSSKGGSGKSTVAISLATYLAHASENSVKEGLENRPLKIIILDLDVRDGQLGFVTGSHKPTVLEFRSKGITDQSLDETIINKPRLKLDILLAPKRPRYSENVPPDFYVDLIQALRKRYDYVILDTSVNYLDPLLEKVAYPTADQIIFVTDIVVSSIFSMSRWIREVILPPEQNGMGIDKRKIGIVVNKYLPEVEMSQAKIEQAAMGLPVISVVPANPRLIATSTNLQSLELVLQHDSMKTSISRLARAIVGNKYKLSNNVH